MSGDIEKALAEFAVWAVRTGPWDGCGLDGADIQDKAESLGLIVKTQFDPDIHNAPEWIAEPGDDWYVLAPEVLALTERENEQATQQPHMEESK